MRRCAFRRGGGPDPITPAERSGVGVMDRREPTAGQRAERSGGPRGVRSHPAGARAPWSEALPSAIRGGGLSWSVRCPDAVGPAPPARGHPPKFRCVDTLLKRDRAEKDPQRSVGEWRRARGP